MIRHPDYVDATLDNDIALLQLASPVTIGGSGATRTAIIPPVPASIGSLIGASSWVTGWGNTSSVLPPECLHNYKRYNFPLLTI
ncbi:MAG: trypsin-like serine protease [Chitinophagaceae bacterium]|nr:trypsin-like serine protease [Chitinophagaceae bacterium]